MINLMTFTVVILASLIILLLIRFNRYKKRTEEYELKLLGQIKIDSVEYKNILESLKTDYNKIISELKEFTKKYNKQSNDLVLSKTKIITLNNNLIKSTKENIRLTSSLNEITVTVDKNTDTIKKLNNDIIRISGMHKLSLDDIDKLEAKIIILNKKNINPKRKYIHHNNK